MNNSITKVINYVLHTLENTNYFVLVSMLEELVHSSFEDIKLCIENGNLYATYENSNIDFSLNDGNLIYNISS